MNSFSLPLSAEGPLVDAEVGFGEHLVRSLRQAGRAIPEPVKMRALLDTGADVTCIDKHVLAPLVARGLPFTRFVYSNVPALGGLLPSLEYDVGLTIPHPTGQPRSSLRVRAIAIIEKPLGALGYQAVIGRDVLDRCLFIYDGPSKSFTLGY